MKNILVSIMLMFFLAGCNSGGDDSQQSLTDKSSDEKIVDGGVEEKEEPPIKEVIPPDVVESPPVEETPPPEVPPVLPPEEEVPETEPEPEPEEPPVIPPPTEETPEPEVPPVEEVPEPEPEVPPVEEETPEPEEETPTPPVEETPPAEEPPPVVEEGNSSYVDLITSANLLTIIPDASSINGLSRTTIVPNIVGTVSQDRQSELYVVGDYIKNLINRSLSDDDGRFLVGAGMLQGAFSSSDGRLTLLQGIPGIENTSYSLNALSSYSEDSVIHTNAVYGFATFSILINSVVVSVNPLGSVYDVTVSTQVDFAGDSVDYNFVLGDSVSGQKIEVIEIIGKESVRANINASNVQFLDADYDATVAAALTTGDMAGLKPYWDQICSTTGGVDFFFLPDGGGIGSSLYEDENTTELYLSDDDVFGLFFSMEQFMLMPSSLKYVFSTHKGNSDSEILAKMQNLGLNESGLVVNFVSGFSFAGGDVYIGCNSQMVRDSY